MERQNPLVYRSAKPDRNLHTRGGERGSRRNKSGEMTEEEIVCAYDDVRAQLVE